MSGEFGILQVLHLKVVNELANDLLEEINEIKKTLRMRDAFDLHDLLTFSCFLCHVLPKWISSEISTTNLIIFGRSISHQKTART